MSQLLFDEPGPKAVLRNRLIGLASTFVVIGLVGFVVYRLVESGQFDERKWQVFTYPLVWRSIGEAMGATLSAFALAAVLSVALGLALSLGRLSRRRWLSRPIWWFTEFFRAIPVLILMMVVYYGLPPLGFSFVTPFASVVCALTLYNGAVLAEVFRAGIQSLPHGQSEAAYAIGLRKNAVLRLVLLPQAVTAMLPVIIAQLVVVLKDTALGFIVTYHELLYLAKFLGSQTVYGSPIIPASIVIGSVYVGLCLVLSGIAQLVDRRMRAARRTTASHSGGALAQREPDGENSVARHALDSDEAAVGFDDGVHDGQAESGAPRGPGS